MSMPKPLDLDTQSTLANMAAEMILLGPCGGAIGLVAFVVFGIVYDSFVLAPMRVSGSAMSAYGQLWALLAILAGMLGTWTTASFVLAWRWSPRGGGTMAILGGVAMGSLMGLLRYAEHSNHGPDPVDAITYHPLMVASLVAVVGGVILTLRKRQRRESVLNAPTSNL
ncbi:MAG: hypothetical protein K8R36_25455 [Planctomycetales bacterium]|nr:hypothetical protein [Planctomycetales bacterium]